MEGEWFWELKIKIHQGDDGESEGSKSPGKLRLNRGENGTKIPGKAEEGPGLSEALKRRELMGTAPPPPPGRAWGGTARMSPVPPPVPLHLQPLLTQLLLGPFLLSRLLSAQPSPFSAANKWEKGGKQYLESLSGHPKAFPHSRESQVAAPGSSGQWDRVRVRE